MSFCRQKKEELAQKVAEERARREEEARRLEAEQARQREEQLRRQAEEERERREREGEERAQKQVGVRPAGPWGWGRVSRVGVQVLPPRLVHALASCTSPRARALPPPGAPSAPPTPKCQTQRSPTPATAPLLVHLLLVFALLKKPERSFKNMSIRACHESDVNHLVVSPHNSV